MPILRYTASADTTITNAYKPNLVNKGTITPEQAEAVKKMREQISGAKTKVKKTIGIGEPILGLGGSGADELAEDILEERGGAKTKSTYKRDLPGVDGPAKPGDTLTDSIDNALDNIADDVPANAVAKATSSSGLRDFFTGKGGAVRDFFEKEVDAGAISGPLTVLADMDANDTAFLKIAPTGGASQTDIHTTSYFSGYLAC